MYVLSTIRLLRGLVATAFLCSIATANAGVTVNQMELSVSGGETVNSGSFSNTKFFVDTSRNGGSFWVQHTDNPGIPFGSDTPAPANISIKYFPMSRYLEVLRAARDITQYGVIDDGLFICDIPSTTIRVWFRSVTLTSTCGPNTNVVLEDEDEIAVDENLESVNIIKQLMVALGRETVDAPDILGMKPEL